MLKRVNALKPNILAKVGKSRSKKSCDTVSLNVFILTTIVITCGRSVSIILYK
jgi:hypothetical protein